MSEVQPGILAAVPASGRYLSFSALPQGDCAPRCARLGELADGQRLVVGLGESLVRALGRDIPGLRSFAGAVGPGLELPATPAALWCWLRGDDRGDLVHLTRAVQAAVGACAALEQVIEAFRHGKRAGPERLRGRHREPDAATPPCRPRSWPGRAPAWTAAASLPCSSGCTTSAASSAMSPQRAGPVPSAGGAATTSSSTTRRRRRTSSAPRRRASTPRPSCCAARCPGPKASAPGWCSWPSASSFDAFEAQLQRMIGAEDGITDALFRFTRPVTGAYFWCPPLHAGRLDLRALGL